MRENSPADRLGIGGPSSSAANRRPVALDQSPRRARRPALPRAPSQVKPVRASKSLRREALVQAQRIQHELERQLAAATIHVPLADRRVGRAAQPVLIVARLLRLRGAQDPVGQLEAELAVRAGADARGSRRTASSSGCAGSGARAAHRPRPRIAR